MSRLQDIHLRLMQQLPVRTHEARTNYGKEQRGGDSTGIRKERRTPFYLAGSNRRAVIIGEKKYASIKKASEALGVHHSAIVRMISEGGARYESQSHQSMVGIAKGKRK